MSEERPTPMNDWTTRCAREWYPGGGADIEATEALAAHIRRHWERAIDLERPKWSDQSEDAPTLETVVERALRNWYDTSDRTVRLFDIERCLYDELRPWLAARERAWADASLAWNEKVEGLKRERDALREALEPFAAAEKSHWSRDRGVNSGLCGRCGERWPCRWERARRALIRSGESEE